MKTIIIRYDEKITAAQAMDRALLVVDGGLVSESAGRKHYCWLTRFTDGTTVSTTRKRRDDSADSFVILAPPDSNPQSSPS